MLGRSIMCLVDWDGGVYDLWVHSLLMDDWLDCLMDLMVNMLARRGREGRDGMVRLVRHGGVLELGGFQLETFFCLGLVVVVEFAVFHGDHVVGVLFGQDLLVLKRLDCSVVVVLMDFTVHCLRDVLMASGLDRL